MPAFFNPSGAGNWMSPYVAPSGGTIGAFGGGLYRGAGMVGLGQAETRFRWGNLIGALVDFYDALNPIRNDSIFNQNFEKIIDAVVKDLELQKQL